MLADTGSAGVAPMSVTMYEERTKHCDSCYNQEQEAPPYRALYEKDDRLLQLVRGSFGPAAAAAFAAASAERVRGSPPFSLEIRRISNSRPVVSG